MKKIPLLSILAFSIAVTPLLFFVISWHYQNNLYPIGDYASLFIPAQSMYFKIIEHGFFYFLNPGVYPHDLSATIITVITVPFLILTKGSSLHAVSSLMILTFIVYATYLFLFINIFFNKRISILSTWFILSIPWLTANFYAYTGEAFFYTFTLAAIYHLTKSNYLKSLKHCFIAGIFIFLSVCTRPFLSTIFLSTFITIYLYYSFRHSSNTYKNILFFTPFVFWALLVLPFHLFLHNNFSTYYALSFYFQIILISISIIALFLLSKKFGLSRELWALILIPWIGIPTWYLSRIDSLVAWFQHGLGSEVGPSIIHKTPPQVITEVITNLGKIDLFIALFLAIISLWLRKLLKIKLKSETKRILVLLSLSSIFSILVQSLTSANTLRHYYFHILILFLFSLIALQRVKIITNIILPIFLFAGVIYQGFYVYCTVFVPWDKSHLLNYYFNYKIYKSWSFLHVDSKPFREIVPYTELFSKLEEHVPKNKPIKIAVIQLPWDFDSSTEFLYTPNLIIYSRENNYSWDFKVPSPPDNISFQEHLKNEFDFVMFALNEQENFASLVDRNVHEKVGAWLIKRFQEFKLGPDKLTGLELKLIFRINSYKNRSPGNIQIYKVLKEAY